MRDQLWDAFDDIPGCEANVGKKTAHNNNKMHSVVETYLYPLVIWVSWVSPERTSIEIRMGDYLQRRMTASRKIMWGTTVTLTTKGRMLVVRVVAFRPCSRC